MIVREGSPRSRSETTGERTMRIVT